MRSCQRIRGVDLQEKERHLAHMMSECVQGQARCFDHTAEEGRLTHIPNLEKMSEAIGDKDAFHPEQYVYLVIYMEDVAAFVLNHS